MCGIVGYFGEGSEAALASMNKTLRHRGPDDSGAFVFDRVGLGHTRLSIIDLSPAGHQPMSNEDGTVTVVFNGEIYNFKELKALLKKKHTFQGSSDTEVIVHLYEEIGEKVFGLLSGMFAIALYDKKAGTLLLARDHFGKKPLFYTQQEGTLIFGSELKALMAFPKFEKQLDLDSLRKYLLYEYVPTPHTILKGVFKLEPGTLLSFDGTHTKKRVFHDFSFSKETPPSFADAVKTFEKKLEEAVSRRMVSDVPLGVLLSGGLDSSSVAYFAQKQSKTPIKTFSIGFAEHSFDESHFARQVAGHLGTEHHERILTDKETLELIPSIAELIDEPLADASLIPTYLLSKFARTEVTVALGGDGGDELMCGYDTFRAHQLASIYAFVPAFMRKPFEAVIKMLPASRDNLTWEFKAKKFIDGFSGREHQRNQRWLGAFSPAEQGQLLSPDVLAKTEGSLLFEDVDRYEQNVKGESRFNRLVYSYIKTYLLDDILVKVDRASMAASLEVRAPLLDRSVADFLNGLPLSYKLRGLTAKRILKKTMEGKLPSDIIYRKKKGFGIPLSLWLAGPLQPLMRELLSKKVLEKQGLFNAQWVEQLMNDHVLGVRDNRKQLWTLIVFQLWWNRWYK